MLWNKARRSDNVNDTREGKDARQLTGKTLGAGLAAAALAGVGLYSALGTTPDILPVETDTPFHSTAPQPSGDTTLLFVQSVLGDTEDTWKQLFAQTGRHYPPPKLTLFSHDVTSGCGYAHTGNGPFYCPDNQQVYLDPEFFAQMAQQFSVIGDFAQAYVLAHEIGHHVQLELGLSEPFEKALANRQPIIGDGGLEVRAELQADCLAGVWAHHAQNAWLGWSPETSTRPCMPPPCSATITCNAPKTPRYDRKRSVMALQSSGRTGSNPGSPRVGSTPAIPSPAWTCNTLPPTKPLMSVQGTEPPARKAV